VIRLAQPLGAILIILAIWLYACDRGNEFVPWVGGVELVLLIIGH
jgi:multisubunit Na+/H+ antiporter MnhG subunit